MKKNLLVLLVMLVVLAGCNQKPSPKKWIYKVIPITETQLWLPKELQDFKYDKTKIEKVAKIYEEKLNEYGEQGWELVKMNNQIILKKQKL